MNDNLFVLHRKNAIAEKRIQIILWYVVECYLLTLKNNKKYSKTWVKGNANLKFENYLRNRLVEDYLEANKYLLKQKTLTLNNIDFSYETEKEYIDTQDNKLKSDKIDIYISKLGLQNEWKKQDKNVYFAIECKRIEKLSDANDYISDIANFCTRDHVKTRLPFEGQIAFIENQNITHIILRDKVNEILLNHNSIITNSLLNSIVLNEKFESAYLSKHQRKASKQKFSIYHLFLNYSNIVAH